MKVCPKCQSRHSKTGTFCSRSCANSRSHSLETKLKQQKSVEAYYKQASDEELAVRKQTNTVNLSKARVVAQANRKAVFDSKDFSELSWGLQRRRVLEEQCNRCAGCGLSEWRGKSLTLEIDHKDGNNKNNIRSNLEALCPNCHSITETWRGRNISYRRKVSDEELIQALNDKDRNIRQALLQVGLVAKGANYTRARDLIQQMDQSP